MSSRSTSQKDDGRGERVQKVLAGTGLASRREIDRLIQQGRVVVDGRPAQPGDRLIGDERVAVDGRPVQLPARDLPHRYRGLAYYKPEGEIATRKDPEGRKTVFDALPHTADGRWIAVGRLDINTSGLLLFSIDGELAHRLMHPSAEIEREYAVRIRGDLSEEKLQQLVSGVDLDDGPARFDSIERQGAGKSNSWLHVVLREGRNREVRRLFAAVGVTVSRLMRIRFGPIDLGRIQRGRFRYLENSELAALYAAAGIERGGPNS